jgi:hypothetical protein
LKVPDQEQSSILDHQKYLHEQNLRAAERAHDASFDFALKTNTAAIDSSNLALRTAMLINGGAAISVLAFAGGLASRDKVPLGQLTQIASTLVWFAFGVAVATLSMGLAYFTNICVTGSSFSQLKTFQHPYLEDTPKSRRYRLAAEVFRWLAVVGAVTSLALFISGMFAVKIAIGSLGKL